MHGQFRTESHRWTNTSIQIKAKFMNESHSHCVHFIQIRRLSFISFELVHVCFFDFFRFLLFLYFFLSHTSHLFFLSPSISYDHISTFTLSLSCHFGPPKAHMKHLKAHFDYRHFEFFVVCSLMWSFQNAFTSLRLILPTGTCISWVLARARVCVCINKNRHNPASLINKYGIFMCVLFLLFRLCVFLIIGFEFYIKCIPSSLHQPRAETLYRLTVGLVSFQLILHLHFDHFAIIHSSLIWS